MSRRARKSRNMKVSSGLPQLYLSVLRTHMFAAADGAKL